MRRAIASLWIALGLLPAVEPALAADPAAAESQYRVARRLAAA